jgi:hypothetical protein
MKISELFLKPIDRPIEGVIKADDERHEQVELDEYVVTRDVTKGLGVFTERYLNEPNANGVWISGFFGSGKSHLLKMLSLVLNGGLLPNGSRPADIILPKIADEIVQAEMRTAAAIPSRSVLFNIDQKFDGVGGDHSAPILEVFTKVLNELKGFYGQQGYVAKFEQDLSASGDLSGFQQTYLRINGASWEDDRAAISTVKRAAFGRAYAAHFGVPESVANDVMRQVREDYKVSIESFALSVKDYIAAQPPGFRLNFFVDEVGQFIGQDSKKMLNLQTLAETLATVCDGRAWIFVTSQADLEGVLGTFRGTEGQDLSKINARFKTQLTLASGDVRQVIQERLLAKKEAEPKVVKAQQCPALRSHLLARHPNLDHRRPRRHRHLHRRRPATGASSRPSLSEPADADRHWNALSQTPCFVRFVSDGLGIPAWLGDVDDDERDVILLGYGGRLPAADLRKQLIGQLRG